MAEIEFNVMVRLSQRIFDIDTLRREVAAWQMHRDQLKVTIDGQFTPHRPRQAQAPLADT